MAKNALNAALEALFVDIDLDAAQATLAELGLPIAYSTAAVAKVNAAADVFCEQAAELKRAEAPRSDRRAVKEQVDRLVNARAFLYRLRPAQPGDIAASPAPVGGNS